MKFTIDEINNMIINNMSDKIISCLKNKEFDKNQFSDILHSLFVYSTHTDYKYGNLYKYFQLIYDNYIVDDLTNNMEPHITFLQKDFIFFVIRIKLGEKFLYNLSTAYDFKAFLTDEISMLYLDVFKYATFPVLNFFLKKIKLENVEFSYDNKRHILKNAFLNSDDRVYKYVLSNSIFITFLKENKSILPTILPSIFKKHIPEKYVLRRLTHLNKVISIKENVFQMINLTRSFDMLYSIIKHNVTDYDYMYLDSKNIPTMCSHICNLLYETTYEKTKENFYKIYSLLPNEYIYSIVVACIFNYKTNFGFELKNVLINEDNCNRIIDWSINYCYCNYATFPRMLYKYIPYDIINNFAYCRIISSFEPIVFKYLGYFNYIKQPLTYTVSDYTERMCSFNKSLFYMKCYIKKKEKFYALRREYKNIKEQFMKTITPIENKIKKTNTSKFSTKPPYHVFPNMINTLDYQILITEKADGELVQELPKTIEPSFDNKYKVKAEYIEDLDLYLVFDIDIDENIISRYNMLRDMHHMTKGNFIKTIDTVEDLTVMINKERKLLEKFLNMPYVSYRWYPKAYWKINNMNSDIIDYINTILNDEDKRTVKWLCNDGPFETDGFIMKPLNGKREFKIKPKSLLTIDLLYKNNKWIDRDGYEYNNIIVSENITEDGIYRCYPMDNMYKAHEIRYDKTKPNTRDIVNNITCLYNIDYRAEYDNVYYHNNHYSKNNKWESIIKSNNSMMKTFITKCKNDNILDLGCGKAKVLKFIENKYTRYYGMDYDMNNIISANTKMNSSRNIFNYIDLSCTWNSTRNKLYNVDKHPYDTIYSINSLMHFCTDKFWEQLDTMSTTGTMFVFNLVNDNLDNYTFGFESYIKNEDNMIKYYFENVHKHEMVEPLITEDLLNAYLTKHGWSIVETYTNNTKLLTSYYTWYRVIKV